VWRHGGEPADDPQRLDALVAHLQPDRSLLDPAVKQSLIDATQAAIERGVFGVPTFAEHDRLFWGQDSLPMLRQYLQGDAWFESDRQPLSRVAPGVRRTIAAT
jgi:hypothetical protein